MPKYTLISDPNHSAGGHQDFRVHAAGCRDIARHEAKPRFRFAGSSWTTEAESAEALVAAEVQILNDQSQEYGASDFKICDCCRAKSPA